VSAFTRWSTLALAAAGLTLMPAPAAAHLFHRSWAPPQTQLTRDTRALQLLLDDPAGRFDLARRVWEGEVRGRPAPAPRRWLVRSTEPGRVFKADYQLQGWSGSLRSEAERLDREHGTRLASRVGAALAEGDREAAHAGLRAMYALLLEEMLATMWERLDDFDAVERLYEFVLAYWSVNLESYFNIRHPAAGAVARTALDAISRALGEPETGAPAAPEAFDKQRQRFLRLLNEGVPRS
jgi:hypothetical protein